MDLKTQIQFVSLAITDTQQLIKNLDSKLTVVITILGSFLVTYVNKAENIIVNFCEYSFTFRLILVLLLLLIALCIILISKILIPTNNPKNHIIFGNKSVPKIDFFLAENITPNGIGYLFHDTVKSKLKMPFDTYVISLNNSDDKELLDSLTFELFKLNYIRNIKYNRFKVLLSFLTLTTIVFFISFIWYTIENQQITTCKL